MARAAIYEKRYGQEDFKINSYYQKDFTLIWITAGFCLMAALLFLCSGESFVEGITITKLIILLIIAVGAYLSLLIIYGIGAGSFYKKKHIQAKQRVKKYMRDLSRLEKMNVKKEKNRP